MTENFPLSILSSDSESRDLKEFVLEHDIVDWNTALVKSVALSRFDLIDDFLRLGADNYNDFVATACEKGDKKIVKKLLTHESFSGKVKDLEWPRFLAAAAFNGHKKIVKTLLDLAKLADIELNLSLAVQSAIYGNKRNVIDYCLKKMKNFDMNVGLYCAVSCNNPDLIDFFTENNSNIIWNVALQGAASNGNEDLFKVYSDKGADCWDWCMRIASGRGFKSIVDTCIENGATDFTGALHHAILGKQTELVELFKSKLV